MAQSVLFVGIAIAGIAGPSWPSLARTNFRVAGAVIGVAGIVLFVGGAVSLGPSLTPYPRPSKISTLREGGLYRFVRHPIYGGVLLIALGWSVARSPLALAPTAVLAVALEMKSRLEEEMLSERYPDYNAYRHRVRWRFLPGMR